MPETAMYKRILVPFDGTDASHRAAQIANEIAAALGSQVIFATPPPNSSAKHTPSAPSSQR